MNQLVKDKIILSSMSLVEIYGPENSNVNFIKSHFPSLSIVARGTEIILEGKQDQIQKCKNLFDNILTYFNRYQSIEKSDIERLIIRGSNKEEISSDFLLSGKNGVLIKPRNASQSEMIRLAEMHNLLFVLGPAGTGKTYNAVALAVQALKEKHVKKVILTRPAVEAGENLGFLPGDLYDKLSPYMRPLYDALNEMLSKDKLSHYMENHQIEIVPLAFMRGCTLDNAFVILDEAQNTTISQMKMFLTRMGPSSQFIVCGDVSQIDLPVNQKSGLIHATNILKFVKNIGFMNFSEDDVIRHELVKNIIKAYKK